MSTITTNLWLGLLCLVAIAVAVTIVVGGLMLLRIGIHDYIEWYRTVKQGKRNLESTRSELRAAELDLREERRERERTQQLLDAAMQRMVENGIAPPRRDEASSLSPCVLGQRRYP